MRPARPLAAAIVLAVGGLAAACTSAAPGWTYAPAPSVTPAPSTSAGPSAEPSGGGSEAPSGPTIEISAKNIQFDTTELTAPADTPFQIVFQNDDEGIPHNVAIRDASGGDLFTGATFNGVDKQTYDVPALAAGSYTFLCTVHPNMKGTLTVQ